MIYTAFDEHRRATPFCLCSACHDQIQEGGLAIVLVVDDGKPLVSLTFCVHKACEAEFITKNPPTRGARWVTFPLAAYLAALLKNTSALEGAERKVPIGH